MEALGAEIAFAMAGGKDWREREAHKERRGEFTSLADGPKAQLLALASGELPLALLPELFGIVEQQLGRERVASFNRAFYAARGSVEG